jgi:hypothetical protein
MLPNDEVGSGPAVVLLHAGIADRTMWAEHLQPLADAGYRAVALDFPASVRRRSRRARTRRGQMSCGPWTSCPSSGQRSWATRSGATWHSAPPWSRLTGCGRLAGHLAPLETPGAFRELVLGFLRWRRRDRAVRCGSRQTQLHSLLPWPAAKPTTLGGQRSATADRESTAASPGCASARFRSALLLCRRSGDG